MSGKDVNMIFYKLKHDLRNLQIHIIHISEVVAPLFEKQISTFVCPLQGLYLHERLTIKSRDFYFIFTSNLTRFLEHVPNLIPSLHVQLFFRCASTFIFKYSRREDARVDSMFALRLSLCGDNA